MTTQAEPIKPYLSYFYDKKKHAKSVDLAKFLLMPFVFFALLGFPIPGVIGNYVKTISSFSGLAFFIFCGFFTLVPDREWRMRKLTRALKRSWKFFLVLFLSYLAINIAYLAYLGQLNALIDPEFLRLRTLVSFLVLNVWPLPIGGSIWFIQSLAYSYLILFVIEKIKLSKIYVPLLIVLLIFTFLSGEFAKIIDFSCLGYSYIPGGFLTKALPFLLIGMLLRKHIDQLARIPRFVYAITLLAGILLSVGELFLLAKIEKLAYVGNMIGYGIMAVSVCCFAVTNPHTNKSLFAYHGGGYSRRMYALCQPISLLIWFGFRLVYPEMLPLVTQISSVMCFVVCFGIALLIGLIKFWFLNWKAYLKSKKED